MDPLEKRPALSLILCSRNDSYMGNSRWRLQTTLNYVANRLSEMGLLNDVEVLVADWGSELPLSEVLQLSPAAARVVSFLHIPPDTARSLQKDSPFAEVLALNAAARRARGDYIGRIDQDTLVGKRFLEVFFDLYEGRRRLDGPLDSTVLFANLRMVPYRLAVRCPPLSFVERFIDRYGTQCKVEVTEKRPFWCHGVGIMLLSKALWSRCGGYDENMLYMNSMEINMIIRLMMAHVDIVNLGDMIGYDFYHLEHYHPWTPRMSRVHRKVNANIWEPKAVNPNGDTWGLVAYQLVVERGRSAAKAVEKPVSTTMILAPGASAHFFLLTLLVRAQVRWDSTIVKSIIMLQHALPSSEPRLRPGIPD